MRKNIKTIAVEAGLLTPPAKSEVLSVIARHRLELSTLAADINDGEENYTSQSVWAIRNALYDAYEAGYAAGAAVRP